MGGYRWFLCVCVAAATACGGDDGDGTPGPDGAGGADSTPSSDGAVADAGNDGPPASRLFSPESFALCDLVNDYREQNALARVPLSHTLFTVGKAHLDNVAYAVSAGIFGLDPNCNLHTWYDEPGSVYGACCYTSDHAQAQCMWDKPREASASSPMPFNSDGFENAASGYQTVAAALDGWKGSPGHNDVILNQGIWANIQFGAMGCGADETTNDYFLWFAAGTDPAGLPQ